MKKEEAFYEAVSKEIFCILYSYYHKFDYRMIIIINVGKANLEALLRHSSQGSCAKATKTIEWRVGTFQVRLRKPAIV